MQTRSTAVGSPKVYVRVHAEFAEDGTIYPREIIWEDGTVYEIDLVTDIRQAVARRAGGQGDRYTVTVRGHKSYLYFERNGSIQGNNIGRWFVERK